MGRKTVETTHNINTFGPEAANEHTAQWWLKKICNRNESLEDERSGQPSEVDNQLRISLKLILLWLHEKLLKNSTWTNLWSFRIWGKLERWKNSVSGYPMSWPQIKKIVILKCCLLLFYTTNHFLIRLWHATKSGLSITTCDDQLSGWTNKQL